MSGHWINRGPYEAQQNFDQYHTTQIKLKLNDKTDADILQWIRQQKKDPDSSVQGAIKKLIRNEISRKG